MAALCGMPRAAALPILNQKYAIWLMRPCSPRPQNSLLTLCDSFGVGARRRDARGVLQRKLDLLPACIRHARIQTSPLGVRRGCRRVHASALLPWGSRPGAATAERRPGGRRSPRSSALGRWWRRRSCSSALGRQWRSLRPGTLGRRWSRGRRSPRSGTLGRKRRPGRRRRSARRSGRRRWRRHSCSGTLGRR